MHGHGRCQCATKGCAGCSKSRGGDKYSHAGTRYREHIGRTKVDDTDWGARRGLSLDECERETMAVHTNVSGCQYKRGGRTQRDEEHMHHCGSWFG